MDKEIDILSNEFADNIWYPSFLPFRTSEGVEFSAQWRVGGIRTKVDLRGTKINYFFRLK